MPIRAPGTPEHEHFRTIRDTVIEPALFGLGYSVVRADDISKSGAISADIVHLLAQSELVVADLTDLNANVFYELGARHALRKNGTIMLVDQSRSDIPFDLQPYRTIKYEPTLNGAELVRRKLREFASSIDPEGAADNPIHTFLPELPADVVAQATGTTEGQLRAQLEGLRAILVRYETEYGKLDEAAESLADVISRLSSDARASLLPSDLLQAARMAHEQRDARMFLEAVEGLGSGLRGISTIQIIEVASWAGNLGLDELQNLLFEEGKKAHPDDDHFERLMLQTLAHSTDSAARRTARERYEILLGVTKVEGRWQLPPNLSFADRNTIAVMLDAFHRDGLHSDALEIARQMVEVHRDCDVALRNFGRALENNDRLDDAILLLRAATARSRKGSGISASWLGNTLMRIDRYFEAAEAYAVAAILDTDDAEHFIDLSTAISRILDQVERDDLPFLLAEPLDERRTKFLEFASAESVFRLAECAFSCSELGANDITQAQIMFSYDQMRDLMVCRQDRDRFVSIPERTALARKIYNELATPLTSDVRDAIERVRELLDRESLREVVDAPTGQVVDLTVGENRVSQE